jgi:hypothetical protein
VPAHRGRGYVARPRRLADHPAALDAALLGVSPGLRAEVQRIADELHDRCLDLHADEKPGARTPGWETVFRQARAAAAVVNALDPNLSNAASGALYEASHALDEDLTQLASEIA